MTIHPGKVGAFQMKTIYMSNGSHICSSMFQEKKHMILKVFHCCDLGLLKQYAFHVHGHSVKLLWTLTAKACSPINCSDFLIGPVFFWGLCCDHQLILQTNSGQNWQAVKGKSVLNFSPFIPAFNYEMLITATQRQFWIQMQWTIWNCLQ